MNSKKGISLISLIITMIVIIILAAIVIFSGFGTTESAQFARFAQDFSSYQEEIGQRYLDAKIQSSTREENKTDSTIYAEMAGIEEDDGQAVSSILAGRELSENISGTNCYMLSDERSFYTGDGGTYITDTGEIFTLPGFRYITNGEERYYVSAGKYYIGEEITNEFASVNVGDYIEYIVDENTYVLDKTITGYEEEDGVVLETDTTLTWRVWAKNPNGSIVIAPNHAVNPFCLHGVTGFTNSIDIINDVCKMYTCNDLGITANNIKSIDRDEIKKVITYDDMEMVLGWYMAVNETFDANTEYRKPVTYTNGTFFVKDEYGHEISKTPIVATESAPLTFIHDSWSPANGDEWEWKNVGNTLEKYDSLIGDNEMYIATSSINTISYYGSSAALMGLDTYAWDFFRFYDRLDSRDITASGYSWGADPYGVYPLITIGGTIKINGGNGSSATPWTLTK